MTENTGQMPDMYRDMGLSEPVWLGLRPDEREFCHEAADGAQPPAGITKTAWLGLSLEMRRALRSCEEKQARAAADKDAVAAEAAAENASEALQNLDGDWTFVRHPGSAVRALVEYAEDFGCGDDVLGPLNVYLEALGALADTENAAADAVQKLVDRAGLDVAAYCT